MTNQKTLKQIKEMQMLNNWSKKTTEQYQTAIKQYTNYHNKTFPELIQEAEEDEENIHKTSKRRLKKRLTTFQLHLKEQGLQNSSIINRISKIKQVYKYNDIELPEIPRLKRIHHETYKDIPTHTEIKHAINNSKTKMRAIITFLASSGLRRSDMVRLTVDDFLKATYSYHKSNNLINALNIMRQRRDVIPTWEITSSKTKVAHITFNSPEATLYIIQLLFERYKKQNIQLNDRLFDIGEKGVTINFSRLNDRLDYGRNPTRRKFHAHSLRTFFSTTLTNNGLDFIPTEFLLGHKLDNVRSSYYYANPEKLKHKYSRFVDKLTFNMNVEYVDINSKEKRELELLRAENKATIERLRHLEELVDILQENVINE